MSKLVRLGEGNFLSIFFFKTWPASLEVRGFKFKQRRD